MYSMLEVYRNNDHFEKTRGRCGCMNAVLVYYCYCVGEECSGLSNCMKEKLVTKESYHRLDQECQTNVTQNQMLPGRQDKNYQNENITERIKIKLQIRQ